MSSKTRKFIGPMSLVAIFAVVGALAAFVVLGLPNANPADAQGFPPTAPTRAQISAGDGEIVVSWRPVGDEGSSAITGYTVQYREVGEPDWDEESVAANLNTATISGLDNGTTYEAQVFGSNSDGAGAPTYAGMATPKANTDPSDPEVTIEQGVLETSGSTQVSDLMVEWEVDETGAAGGLTYTATYTLDGAATTTDAPAAGTTLTEFTINNIEVGVVVDVTVVATNTATLTSTGTVLFTGLN